MINSMKILELIKDLYKAEKMEIIDVVVAHNPLYDGYFIRNVTCAGIDTTVDIKLTFPNSVIYSKHELTFGLMLRELIKELQSMMVGYGSNIEVTCKEHTIKYVKVCDGKVYIII